MVWANDWSQNRACLDSARGQALVLLHLLSWVSKRVVMYGLKENVKGVHTWFCCLLKVMKELCNVVYILSNEQLLTIHCLFVCQDRLNIRLMLL